MPFIAPFRAIRYNPARFSDLSPLLTPPYDVISDAEQASHYARHPHNMIRLDLGQILPTDSDRDNRYSRAARLFAQWRREAIFIQDERPALYPTSIRYTTPGGETKTLLGLFALGDVPENALNLDYLPVPNHWRCVNFRNDHSPVFCPDPSFSNFGG